MDFQIIKHSEGLPKEGKNIAYLISDNWDDFGFKTLFQLVLFDETGNSHEIGSLKISYFGQEKGWTSEKVPQKFSALDDEFYSLGLDIDYYTKLIDILGLQETQKFLEFLNDIANDSVLRDKVKNEKAFEESLLRDMQYSSIQNQYHRVLRGKAALTKYDFTYVKDQTKYLSEIKLDFKAIPYSKPSTNMHVLIGRNGVGKTTILKNMTYSLVKKETEYGRFVDGEEYRFNEDFPDEDFFDDMFADNNFSGLVSISFSAFDSYDPPADNSDPNQGRRFAYIGLKQNISEEDGDCDWVLKDKAQLSKEFANSLKNFLAYSAKKKRWENAIDTLESDPNFKDLDFEKLIASFDRDSSKGKGRFKKYAAGFFEPLSSGHAIVLLSITKLVETVEERTIVLLDEPESHLHPPLLAAFIRALNDLLINRNGLAIIATHSPVVLQEIPKTCVNFLNRNGIEMNITSPEIETFAENVGILTREVFRLEASKSGFHDLLTKSVEDGKRYEDIVKDYGGQIGFEGKAMLRSMLLARDQKGEHKE